MAGRVAFVVALSLLLAACASRDTQLPGAPSWETQLPDLRALSHWTLRAKVSLRTPRGTDSARLRWRQAGPDSDLSIAGPLGAGAVALSRRGNRLVFRDGDTERELAADDPAALAAAVGWPVPVNALSWWLRGLPAPASTATRTPTDGPPERIAQQGWIVNYGAFVRSDGLLLPEALTLRYPPAAVELRIVAARWQPGQTP